MMMIKGVANDLINFNACLWKHFMNIFFSTNGELKEFYFWKICSYEKKIKNFVLFI
jgi:hypothetical protein